MDPATCSPRDIIAKWKQLVEASPKRLQAVRSSISFHISGEAGGTWVVRPDEGTLTLSEEPAGVSDAACSIALSERDFLALAASQIDPQTAFREGVLKLAGGLDAALQCSVFLDTVLTEQS